MPLAIPAHSIKLAVGVTLEVIVASALFMLLLAENHEDIVNGFQPCISKHGGIACYLPILISQADGVAL